MKIENMFKTFKAFCAFGVPTNGLSWSYVTIRPLFKTYILYMSLKGQLSKIYGISSTGFQKKLTTCRALTEFG